MTMQIGGAPGVQYTGTEYLQGKCPTPGTVYRTQDGKEYVMAVVAASQNLVDGHLVSIDGSFVVTIVAAGPQASNLVQKLGVARTSVTASASAYIWVQVYGAGSVKATTSTLPNVR